MPRVMPGDQQEESRQSKAINIPGYSGPNGHTGLYATSISGMPNSSNGFSVTFWVNLDDDNTSVRHVYHDDTRAGVHAGVWFNNNNLYFRGVSGTGAMEVRWSVTMSDFVSTWTQVAICWDGNLANG